MYVMYKLKYTYISQTKGVHKGICMKARGSRMYMYNQQLRQDRHIHEVKTQYHKTFPKWGIQVRMYESSKLDYTSTSNGYKYKQAFKHKGLLVAHSMYKYESQF